MEYSAEDLKKLSYISRLCLKAHHKKSEISRLKSELADVKFEECSELIIEAWLRNSSSLKDELFPIWEHKL